MNEYDSFVYAPILRFKQGELKGIKNLNENIKKRILPFFYVDEDFNDRNIKLLPQISMIYPSSQEVYKDFLKKSQNSDSAKKLIPVFKDIRKIEGDGDFCFHVLVNSDEKYELTGTEVKAENGVLILDFQSSSLSQRNIEIILASFVELINMPWKRIFVGGASAPSILKSGKTTIERTEWTVIYDVVKSKFNNIFFSDYGIQNEERMISEDLPYTPAAKIRYTTNEYFINIKGKSFRKIDSSQYKSLSNEIVSSGSFAGKDYSWGDDFIYKCAQGNVETYGNLAKWVSVCTNHHFTHVVKQFPNL